MTRAKNLGDPTHSVKRSGSLHPYRTEVPNTIVKGHYSRNLSIYAKWLYVFLKSIAEDDAAEPYGITRMAEMTGMARGQIVKARNELKNKGLIRVKPGKRKNRDTLNIYIVDIWAWNMKEFSVHTMNTELEVGVHTMNTEHEHEAKQKQEDKAWVFTTRTPENFQCSPHEHQKSASVHTMNTQRPIYSKKKDPDPDPDLGIKDLEKDPDNTAKKQYFGGAQNTPLRAPPIAPPPSTRKRTYAPRKPKAQGWPAMGEWLKEFLEGQDSLTEIAIPTDPHWWIQVVRACEGATEEFLAAEFAKMEAWLLENPSRRPTETGTKRFIRTWLIRAKEQYRRRNHV